MIRAVFADNEGCVVPNKGTSFDLEQLGDLRRYIHQSLPVPFALCTGRSVPYSEAMAHALGLLDSSLPFVCEAGATLYEPHRDRYRTIAARSIDFEQLESQLVPGSFRRELGKIASFSVFPEDGYTVDDLDAQIRAFAQARGLHVARSKAAVDITPPGVDKAFGLRAVCDSLPYGLDALLCIGDSNNDKAMLELAGTVACPRNATKEVRDIVERRGGKIADDDATAGVLQILEHYRDDYAPPPEARHGAR